MSGKPSQIYHTDLQNIYFLCLMFNRLSIENLPLHSECNY